MSIQQQRRIENLSLDGGRLCLDFINTISDRYSEDPFDYLSDYEKILEWSVKVRLLMPPAKKELGLIAQKDESRAKKVHGRIIEAREVLYDYFLAIAQNESPDEHTQKQFNGLLAETMSRLELSLSEKLELRHDWRNRTGLKFPLYPVIKSAYDLLTAGTPERIKECGACGWLFLDQSKNRSRKWCSMETCGSNVKAKRYYHRMKSSL